MRPTPLDYRLRGNDSRRLDVSGQPPAQILMEVHHAVFHRRLVRAGVALAALPQGAPAAVHAPGDLVVLDRGLPVSRLLGLDEFALEQHDVFRVVELDDDGRVLWRAWKEGADHEHV